MPSYRTILVPTDFGGPATAALDYAVELARPFNADVVVVHAYAIPVIGSGEGPLIMAELTQRILQAAQACLDEAVAVHAKCGVPMRAFIREGDPWVVTLEMIKEAHADLVVMGTHGRKGLPRFLIGSVAEKVVRTSPVPVLTVHPLGHYEDVHVARDAGAGAAAGVAG
jgi:nucleotide-binding universal stress UspA family protein